tara:strand:+ start:54 stop:833 length:780 start_codon:yes stop_codon:yes gene_type:complete
MIKNLIYIVLILTLTSCEDEPSKKSSGVRSQSNDSSLNTIDSVQSEDSGAIAIGAISDSIVQVKHSDSINIIDSNGLRQGKWIVKGWKDKILEIKTYKNDTLNGLYQKLDGTPYDVNYVMGKREGFQRTFYKNPTRLLSVDFYEDDSIIWTGFPAANENILTPVKHFHSTIDSIFISAPYENGKTWYEGNFCLRPSEVNNGRMMTYCYGLHKMYFRNGKMKGIVDYKNETIQEFDSLGNELYKVKFEEYEVHKQPLLRY